MDTKKCVVPFVAIAFCLLLVFLSVASATIPAFATDITDSADTKITITQTEQPTEDIEIITDLGSAAPTQSAGLSTPLTGESALLLIALLGVAIFALICVYTLSKKIKKGDNKNAKH